MAKKTQSKTFDDASSWFRNHEFEITEAPGTSGRVFLKKYNVSAAIERAEDGGVKIFAYPGYLVGGDRKSTRLNSSHSGESRMPSSA